MADPSAHLDPEPLFGVTQSAQGREWRMRSAPDRVTQAIVQTYDLEEPIARILAARDFTKETAGPWLNPSLRDQMPDPSRFKDMDKAVSRMVHAINNGEKIAIFGDYDVDGATSTSVLQRYLKAIGITARTHIPDRFAEGYGPNAKAMQSLAHEGATLCVTVDCGTTAFEPIAAANQAGMDVIVVDHHAPEPQLPEALAVINPVRLDESGEFNYLAAVGVTYLFVVGLNRALRQQGFFNAQRGEPNLLSLLDLVALGTVADVVKLIGLNRVFVAQGLKVMGKRENAGITALCDVAGLKEAPEAWHLGFLLGPRVNAGGRVGRAGLGVDLLTTDSTVEATSFATALDQLNRERQAIEGMILEEALAKAEEQAEAGRPFIMVSGETWHPGVIGIVASRLKERFNLPAVVIGSHEGKWTGSGRSIPGVDIGAAVISARQSGLLIKGGGHMMACGLSIDPAKLDDFNTYMVDRMAGAVEAAGGPPPRKIDAVVTPSAITNDFIRNMNAKLGPYGQANSEPVLALQSVRLVYAKLTTGGQHIMCRFAGSDGRDISGISFRSADQPLGKALLEGQGQLFHVVGSASLNTYNGRTTPQLRVDDIALA